MRISDWSSDVCSSDRALAGSVVLSPQAARASAPIEVRRTVRSRVMFFFLHKGANAGLLSGLERKVEFRFERGPGGDFGVAPVDEKTGRAFDMVGAAADVGHAGEFGLRDLAAQRRVELRLRIASRAHLRCEAGVGGDLPPPPGPRSSDDRLVWLDFFLSFSFWLSPSLFTYIFFFLFFSS